MYTCLTRYTNSPIVSGTCTETLYRLKRAVGMSLIGRMYRRKRIMMSSTSREEIVALVAVLTLIVLAML